MQPNKVARALLGIASVAVCSVGLGCSGSSDDESVEEGAEALETTTSALSSGYSYWPATEHTCIDYAVNLITTTWNQSTHELNIHSRTPVGTKRICNYVYPGCWGQVDRYQQYSSTVGVAEGGYLHAYGTVGGQNYLGESGNLASGGNYGYGGHVVAKLPERPFVGLMINGTTDYWTNPQCNGPMADTESWSLRTISEGPYGGHSDTWRTGLFENVSGTLQYYNYVFQKNIGMVMHWSSVACSSPSTMCRYNSFYGEKRAELEFIATGYPKDSSPSFGKGPNWASFPGGAPVEVAFQANTGVLWVQGTAGARHQGFRMMPGTSPSIASLPGGGFVVAFQANTGVLWTAGTRGTKNWGLGMMAGTSSSVVGLPGGGFQIAFQTNTGSLRTVGSAANADLRLGMMRGTSPSITGLPGGRYQIAFQANTGYLWTTDGTRYENLRLGMMRGTSPSITGLTGGRYQIAFQANTGYLWTTDGTRYENLRLGMMRDTSPAITALSNGGYQIAFQANTGYLWTAGSAGVRNWELGMMPGTSPSIAARPNGGFKAAFQANTSMLWTAGPEGVKPLQLGMMPGTSPADL